MKTASVRNIQTSFVEIIADKKKSGSVSNVTAVFLIAGNPGTVEFYASFLKQLSDSLNNPELNVSGESFDIYSSSHAGHHLRDEINNSNTTYGLDFQIDHQIAFVHIIIDRYEKAGGKVKIVLIGHSIGSYFVLRMLQKDSRIQSSTTHISLLMPFILWDNIPFSHRLKLNAFVVSPSVQRVLTTVIQSIIQTIFNSVLVPKALLKWIIETFVVSKAHCSEWQTISDILCNRLFTPRLVGNFLHMGADEIRNVPRDQHEMLSILRNIDVTNKHLDKNRTCSLENLKSHQSTTTSTSPGCNIHLLYTDHDEWAPSQDVSLLYALFAPKKGRGRSESAERRANIHYLTGSFNTSPRRFKKAPISAPVPTYTYQPPYIKLIRGVGHMFTMRDDSSTLVCKDVVHAILSSSKVSAESQEAAEAAENKNIADAERLIRLRKLRLVAPGSSHNTHRHDRHPTRGTRSPSFTTAMIGRGEGGPCEKQSRLCSSVVLAASVMLSCVLVNTFV